MNKVIKIHGLNYQVANSSSGSVCGKCAFYYRGCPTDDDTNKLMCREFGYSAYFVTEPSKPLTEESKEAAGITEKTYTQQ